MTEKVNFLPLGSIVVVSGGIKKYVIVARALKVKINGKEQFFDYAACAYPEGMVGDRLMYFQHSDVSKVVFEGFSDDDEKMMCANIQKAMEMLEIERAVHALVTEVLSNLVNALETAYDQALQVKLCSDTQVEVDV